MYIPEHVIEFMLELRNKLGVLNPRIAGGAVRDTILGQPVKDWDVFTDVCPPLRLHTLLGTVGEQEWERDTETHWDKDIKRTKYGLVLSHGFVTYKHKSEGTVVEIIANGMGIHEFDHAICQVSFDLMEYKMVRSPHFLKCIDTQKHTIFVSNLKTPTQTAKCFHNHTPRILAKYPWPVELCYE